MSKIRLMRDFRNYFEELQDSQYRNRDLDIIRTEFPRLYGRLFATVLSNDITSYDGLNQVLINLNGILNDISPYGVEAQKDLKILHKQLFVYV